MILLLRVCELHNKHQALVCEQLLDVEVARVVYTQSFPIFSLNITFTKRQLLIEKSACVVYNLAESFSRQVNLFLWCECDQKSCADNGASKSASYK